MNKEYFIIRPTGSLCNKLRVILSYKNEYPNKLIKVLWLMNDSYKIGCKFEDYFESIENVKFYYDEHWDEFNKLGIDYTGCSSINNNYDTSILKPNKYIEDKINLFLKDIDTFNAIHVRRTDFSAETNRLSTMTSDEEFESYIKENSNVKIYLATDNSSTQKLLSEKYKNIFFYDKIKNNSTEKYVRNTPMDFAIIDIFICSKATDFLGTRGSSFSDMIEFLRH